MFLTNPPQSMLIRWLSGLILLSHQVSFLLPTYYKVVTIPWSVLNLVDVTVLKKTNSPSPGIYGLPRAIQLQFGLCGHLAPLAWVCSSLCACCHNLLCVHMYNCPIVSWKHCVLVAVYGSPLALPLFLPPLLQGSLNPKRRVWYRRPIESRTLCGCLVSVPRLVVDLCVNLVYF